MVIGRRSNEHNSAILQAIEVKQTLLNFFFDSLSNDTKLYGFGWKNAKSAGLPTNGYGCSNSLGLDTEQKSEILPESILYHNPFA